MSARARRYGPLDLPGPSPRDMIAGLGRIRRDPIGWLAAQDARFGPAFALPLPRTPVLVVHDPDDVRHVLIDAHRRYGKHTPQYRALARLTGDGLLAADADLWRTRRRLLAPAFAPERLGLVADVAAQAGKRWAARAVEAGERGRDDAVADSAAVAALHVLLDAVLVGPGTTDALDAGEIAPGRDAAAVARGVADAASALIRHATSPVPAGWPGPSRRALRRAVARVEADASALLAYRARRPSTGDDVLGCLLRARDEGLIDDAGIRDELLTQLVAGHETVAVAIAWTLHLLAAHPDRQDAVRDDPDAARRAVEEAVRLHPPAWVITRRCLEPDHLAGVAVPVGTLVIISPAVLHRRPALFADPDAFDPDRFAGARPGAVAARLATSGAYLPFGAGPRQCIGRDVAVVESVAILRTLLADARVTPGARTPSAVPGVTLAPDHGTLRITPRGTRGA